MACKVSWAHCHSPLAPSPSCGAALGQLSSAQGHPSAPSAQFGCIPIGGKAQHRPCTEDFCWGGLTRQRMHQCKYLYISI